MALQIAEMKRVFELKDGNRIDDPNPNMTPDEVMTHYSSQFPELTTATISGPEIKDGEAVYTFKTTVGTKG